MTDNPTGPESPRVRFIPPSYELRARAPLTTEDLATIAARGERALGRHHGEFLKTLRSEVAALQAAFEKAVETSGAEEAVATLDDKAHVLRGLGGTFGYATVTDICAILCGFLEARSRLSEGEIEVVRLHVNAVTLAADKRLDGATAEGRLVLDGLRRVAS